MNKRHIKFFTVLLTVTILTGVSIFYACKKEEVLADPIQQTNIKIDVDLSCIDFNKISISNSKNGTMLVFNSFEDYTQAIDALLKVCEKYSEDYLVELEKELGTSIEEADEDRVAAIIARDNFFPYNPVMNFNSKLSFTNTAYSMLRAQEIQWTKGDFLSVENPFDEFGIGYVQSAMHNESGLVQIGSGIGNHDLWWIFDDGGGTTNPPPVTCKTNAEQYKDSPIFSHKNKNRKVKGLLRTHDNRTYCKTGNYYQDKYGSWILWTNRVYLKFSGAKSCDCPTNQTITPIPYTENTSWTGLTEKYFWHTLMPTYLSSANSTLGITGMHSCNNYSSVIFTNLY